MSPDQLLARIHRLFQRRIFFAGLGYSCRLQSNYEKEPFIIKAIDC